MNELTFETMVELLEGNQDKKYAADCIYEIKNESGVFESGIIMPKDHISNLYKLRYDIACEKANSTKEDLEDYKNCVSNLFGSKSVNLGISFLLSWNYSFLIFYENDTKIILGILKNKNNLDLNNYHTQKGKHFSQGILIE